MDSSARVRTNSKSLENSLREELNRFEVNSLDTNNKSVLHRAILGGASLDFIRWLVQDQKANINLPSGFFSAFITEHLVLELDQAQAIHLATLRGDEELFHFLASEGADLHALVLCFNEEWSLLHCACKFGQTELFCFLIMSGVMAPPNNTLLHIACGEGYADLSKCIIGQSLAHADNQCRAWWGQKDNAGNLIGGRYFGTPLFAAIMKGSVETVELLIDLGCNVNAKGATESGLMGGYKVSQQLPIGVVNHISPLHLAAYRGIPRIIEILLSEGADPLFKCTFSWLKTTTGPVTPYEVARVCAETRELKPGGPLDANWNICLELLVDESQVSSDECKLS